MFKKIKIYFYLAIFFYFLSACPVKAFTISPLKYSATLGGGDNQDFIVSVENNSNIRKQFIPTIIGLIQDDRGHPLFEKNIDIAENWVKVNPASVELDPGKKTEFVFNIYVPKNTPPGAHYLGLGVEEKNGDNIGANLATIVSFQVAGLANESLRVDNFYPSQKYFFNDGFNYFLQIKNTGNVDLPVSGLLNIVSFDNKNIFSQSLNIGSKLFSGSNRSVDIHLSKNKVFFPGYYKAMVRLNYGLTNQEAVSVVNFWYFPIWFCVGILFVVFVIFLYLKKRHEVAR